MSFISFEFNKKHIFFILSFLSYSIRYFVVALMSEDENEKAYETKFFNTYIYTFSNFFSLFFYCIIKIRSKRKNKNGDQEENKLKRIKTDKSYKSNLNIELIYSNEKPISFNKLLLRTLLVAISDFIAQYSIFLFNLFVNIEKVKLDLLLIFSILSIYIFSRILLKTFYYKHHKLSFFINIICLIIMGSVDIYNIYPKWNIKILYYILINIFSSVCYSFEDVIGKKALTEEFLTPYSLLIYKGVYELIIIILFSIPFFFYKIQDENLFFIFAKKLNSCKKIILVFLLLIINFAYNVFIWIINERFSPNDLSMSMAVEGIISIIDLMIFNFEKFKDELLMSIYEMFIYFILMIGAAIHNEIIVLYFYGLHEYTKKNLSLKAEEDFKNANSKNYSRSTIISENLDINEREDRGTCVTELSSISD